MFKKNDDAQYNGKAKIQLQLGLKATECNCGLTKIYKQFKARRQYLPHSGSQIEKEYTIPRFRGTIKNIPMLQKVLHSGCDC